MPVIKFIEFDGTEHEVDADAGMSVMEVAMKYDVPGIDADCGGGAVCGTCHCFIEESAGPLPMLTHKRNQCWAFALIARGTRA